MSFSSPFRVVILALSLPALAAAQEEAQSAEEWLSRCREDRSRRTERHCEIRENFTVQTGTAPLRVNAGPNGSIRVFAWNQGNVKLVAKVQAQAPDLAEAREIAEEIRVEVVGRSVRSSGPRGLSGRRSWSVSFDVYTPAGTDLNLSTTNGGLVVEGVSGQLTLESTNGSIRLSEVSGGIRAETTNGSIVAELAGQRWAGPEMDLETTNGGIRLIVPEGFSADLDASTTNGGIEVDFPVTVQGRISRRISGKIGNGGPPIRLRTTNGGIAIRKA